MAGRAIASIVLLGAFLAAHPAQAHWRGGSNLGFLGYPAPSCVRPGDPPRKPHDHDRFQTGRYVRALEAHARRVQDYNECIGRYVQAARNDLGEVSEAAQAPGARRPHRFRPPGSSNFPVTGYPGATEKCRHVRGESRQRCVREYIDNARGDSRAIVDRIEEALR